jgi:hypothetical protein
MKRTIFSPCELRNWLEANQGTIKAAVLAEPSGRDFIIGYLNKAGIGFDQDDSDCQCHTYRVTHELKGYLQHQRIIAAAGSWVTRWRLGYQ